MCGSVILLAEESLIPVVGSTSSWGYGIERMWTSLSRDGEQLEEMNHAAQIRRRRVR